LVNYYFPEGDPSNYLTYFKRGTVYLALGKARFALSDFTKVLDLKPDFHAARAQRASVYLKLGDYDNAEIDYDDVVSSCLARQRIKFSLSLFFSKDK
jgi:DnaJ homolog subfamily C member 3